MDFLNLFESSKKPQGTPLAQVKRIKSCMTARSYLSDDPRRALSQAGLARLIGIDPSVVSKVENGKVKFSNEQFERLSLAIAKKFRNDTWGIGRLWGLKYSYNSPMRFVPFGICKKHHVEYPLRRMTDQCPKCTLF